jgi:hypothetical protein
MRSCPLPRNRQFCLRPLGRLSAIAPLDPPIPLMPERESAFGLPMAHSMSVQSLRFAAELAYLATCLRSKSVAGLSTMRAIN